jgi:hypothetical protein
MEESKWFSKENPLWVPQGTIRALLVLGLTWALIIIMLKFAVYKEEIPATVKELMASLLPAIVLLIKDYLSLRKSEAQIKP